MHRLGQQVLAVSGTGAFSTEKSNWSWPQPISISFLKSWREYFEWMTCFPFLASHPHAAYSEDFFDCRGETFISKEHCPRKNFSDCFACRIYIGLKMKILISCHVKIDAAREIKIMFSAAQDYPPIYFWTQIRPTWLKSRRCSQRELPLVIFVTKVYFLSFQSLHPSRSLLWCYP